MQVDMLPFLHFSSYPVSINFMLLVWRSDYQVSAVTDKPAQCTASWQMCCKQRWTLSLVTELSWQRLWRSTLSSYSKLFVISRQFNFNLPLPHLHLETCPYSPVVKSLGRHEGTARQSCAMVPKWRFFFASCIFSEPRAPCVEVW